MLQGNYLSETADKPWQAGLYNTCINMYIAYRGTQGAPVNDLGSVMRKMTFLCIYINSFPLAHLQQTSFESIVEKEQIAHSNH